MKTLSEALDIYMTETDRSPIRGQEFIKEVWEAAYNAGYENQVPQYTDADAFPQKKSTIASTNYPILFAANETHCTRCGHEHHA